MTTDFSFTDDMLDVRDLIERYEELESERDSFFDDRDFPDSERGNKENPIWDEWEKSDEAEELNQLQDILEELKGGGGDEQWKGDWYPVTLINEDYFTDSIEELVKECCGFPKDVPWWVEIDWEKTADNCKVDYTTIEIGEETYYYR